MLEVVGADLLGLVLEECRCPSPTQAINPAKGLTVTLSWPVDNVKPTIILEPI